MEEAAGAVGISGRTQLLHFPLPALTKKRKSFATPTPFSPIKFARNYVEWVPLQLLPAELLFQVFAFLPLKDRCCMALVCWYWKSLIDDTLRHMASLDLSSASPLRFPGHRHQLTPNTFRMDSVCLFFATKCKKLRSINLEGCRMITTGALHTLITAAVQTRKPKLKWLYLASCNVSNDTLITIAEAKCKNKLRVLNLYDTQVDLQSQIGLVRLFQSCKGLRYINICKVQKTHKCYRCQTIYSKALLNALIDLPHLDTLYLDLDNLAPDDIGETSFVNRFLAAHPKAILCEYRRKIYDDRTYMGEMNRNEMHGKGKLVWQDGTSYEGDFREGKMHGVGVCVWEEGKSYTGEWKNGLMDGEGAFYNVNGEHYEGGFRQGKKHGSGKLYNNGVLMQEEEWCNGKRKKTGNNNNKKGRKYQSYPRRIIKPTMF